MNLVARVNLFFFRMFFLNHAKKNIIRPRPVQLSRKSRVLIFSCAGIGDTLTDSVVFKALAKTFPGIYLAQVVHERRRLLAEHNPYVSKIYTLKKGWVRFYKLYRALKSDGPWDAILHLRGNDPEPRCLSYSLNAEQTVGITHMSKLNILCGHNLTFNDWDETHGVEQTLRLARYVGADIDKPHLVYEIKKEESEAFETRAKTEFALSDKPRIVLQLGGGRRASWRDWPIERYAELIFLLRQNLEDVDIIVLGGRDHEHRRRELALKAPPKSYVDCVGKLSIRESAALLASARVVVSTDTGMMHLGFAVGTRVVALIHCNNPANRVGPYGYGDRHRVVQLARPAGYQKPSDANMADISAHEVLSATLDLYRSREREG